MTAHIIPLKKQELQDNREDELDKILDMITYKTPSTEIIATIANKEQIKSQILDWHNKNLLEAIKEHNKWVKFYCGSCISFLQKCIETLKVYNQAQEVKNERR